MVDRALRAGVLQGWLMAAFLTACYTLSIVDRQVIAFLATDIKHELGVSDLQLGLVQGFAFSMCYALASVPLGWAVDRLRRTRVLGVALLIWTGSTFACGLAGGFRSLALARIGIGSGEAALTPGAFSLLADMLPKRQFAAASTLYSLGPPLAIALAALLSAVMLGAAEGGTLHLPVIGAVSAWRATFFAAASPGVLFGVVFLLLREPRRSTGAVAQRTVEPLSPFLRRSWRLHGSFTLLGMLSVLLFYSFNAWNPSILARDFHWSPGRIGAFLGSVGLVSGLAGVLFGGTLASWLVAQRPARILWILAGGQAVTAVCGVAAILARTGELFAAAAVIAAAAAPMMMMVAPVLLQIVTPPALRGRVTAMFLLVGTGLGAGAGPTLVGALSTLLFPAGRLAPALGIVAVGAGLAGTAGSLALYGPMTRAAQAAERAQH